jgi:predicted glycosyltransferase
MKTEPRNVRHGRVFFYVQHLLGIGHAMRAAILTRAMRRAGLDVTYVAGGFEPLAMCLAGADRVQLPPLRAADARYRTLIDEQGRPLDDTLRAIRKRMLLDAFDRADPDVVLIETFPFGRWPLRFELLPLLDAARGRARIACSVRDVLVPKTEPARLDAIVSLIAENFDRVFVHGDPRLIAFDETFPRAPEIADRLRYTGYVADARPRRGTDRRGNGAVIVSAGGARTGGPMMRAAGAARPLSTVAGAPWRFLAGPDLPARDWRALRRGPGLTVEPARPDFRALLNHAAVSVSQGGYNTVMDVLTTRVRSVLVPFGAHGQSEQTLRARRLARRGWVQLVEADRLSPRTLAAAIDRACRRPAPDPRGLDLDGARKTAAMVAALARGH